MRRSPRLRARVETADMPTRRSPITRTDSQSPAACRRKRPTISAAAIDNINAEHGREFRLLQGIEANIGNDGRLDLSR